MGRVKIDTNHKLPEKKINPTFKKRKNGAVNKVKQLGKLCDCDVALITFYPKEDEVIVVSHGGSVDEIFHKYQRFRQNHQNKVHVIEELRPHRQEPLMIPNPHLQQAWAHPNGEPYALDMDMRVNNNMGSNGMISQTPRHMNLSSANFPHFSGMQAPGSGSSLGHPQNAYNMQATSSGPLASHPQNAYNGQATSSGPLASHPQNVYTVQAASSGPLTSHSQNVYSGQVPMSGSMSGHLQNDYNI